MSKLRETLSSKRFQLFALSILVAVGAVLTGDLTTGEMWRTLRENAGAYLAAIVAVQAFEAKAAQPAPEPAKAPEKPAED